MSSTVVLIMTKADSALTHILPNIQIVWNPAYCELVLKVRRRVSMPQWLLP